MGFRNFENVQARCVECTSAFTLQHLLNDLLKKYDFIDLQFSTHYDADDKADKYCALLLLTEKNKKGEKSE